MKALILALFVMATSIQCSEATKSVEPGTENPPCTTTQVDMIDYVLNSKWNWVDTPNNQLIIVRTSEELKNYIMPTDMLPEIDFSTHTLLLVSGGATNGISGINKQLEKDCDGKYFFEIDVLLNDTTEAPIWRVSVLVPSLANNTPIELKLNI